MFVPLSLPQCHVTPTLRELAEAVEVAMAGDRAKRSFSMAIVLDHMLRNERQYDKEQHWAGVGLVPVEDPKR
jgi:hypothetical protein